MDISFFSIYRYLRHSMLRPSDDFNRFYTYKFLSQIWVRDRNFKTIQTRGWVVSDFRRSRSKHHTIETIEIFSQHNEPWFVIAISKKLVKQSSSSALFTLIETADSSNYFIAHF